MSTHYRGVGVIVMYYRRSSQYYRTTESFQRGKRIQSGCRVTALSHCNYVNTVFRWTTILITNNIVNENIPWGIHSTKHRQKKQRSAVESPHACAGDGSTYDRDDLGRMGRLPLGLGLVADADRPRALSSSGGVGMREGDDAGGAAATGKRPGRGTGAGAGRGATRRGPRIPKNSRSFRVRKPVAPPRHSGGSATSQTYPLAYKAPGCCSNLACSSQAPIPSCARTLPQTSWRRSSLAHLAEREQQEDPLAAHKQMGSGVELTPPAKPYCRW